MRSKRAVAFVALAMALSLLAAACGGGDDDGGTAATSAPAAQKQLELGPGFDGETIKVGILTPVSGLAALIGNPLVNGQQAYWEYLNTELGGVAGKYPVDVVLEDTLYETNTTVQKYNKVKGDVVLFAQVMGTPPNLALLPFLEDDNIVVSPASQDAFWVREQHLLPIIEPYQVDVINAMDYFLNEGGGQGKRIGAVIQNDVYGEAGLQGLEFAAERMGFEIAAVARFKYGDQDFTAQISQLKGEGVDAVWAVAMPAEFGGLLTAATKLDYAPQWIAQSPAWIDELGAGPLRDYLEQHVWIAATGPEWGDTSVPGVQELLDRVDKYRPDQEPDYYFSFGYYQAMAVHQLLERAVEMRDLSRDGIVAAMNSLDKLDFGGIIGDYGYGAPDERNPSRVSTVFKVNMDKPFGLESLKVNFTTDLAQEFEFPKVDF